MKRLVVSLYLYLVDTKYSISISYIERDISYAHFSDPRESSCTQAKRCDMLVNSSEYRVVHKQRDATCLLIIMSIVLYTSKEMRHAC